MVVGSGWAAGGYSSAVRLLSRGVCRSRRAYDGGVSVLDVLLEGFDDAQHPRGRHGRWIATFHHPVHGRITQPIEASSSSEAWSKARSAMPGATVQSVEPHVPAPRALPTSRRATLGKAEGAAAAATHAEILRKSPNAQRELSAYQAVLRSSRARGAAEVDAQMAAFKRGEVQRPRVRGDGRSGPIAPSAPALGHPDDPGNPNRQRARDAQLHSQTVRHLENLPQGRYLHVAGVANGGAIARRTAAGFEVYRANQAKPDRVHKTPSAAAAHMVRIRKAGLAPVREAQPMVLGALLEGR